MPAEPREGDAERTKQTVGGAPRLRWRAVIHAAERPEAGRGQQSLAWHLADCREPSRLEAHCDLMGRRLMALDGNPDGHCLVDGICPRCQQAETASAEPEPAPAEPAPAEPAAAEPGLLAPPPAPEPPAPGPSATA